MNESQFHSRRLEPALLAVQRATAICLNVQANRKDDDAIDKQDRSPVTVADFAVQALVISELDRFDSESNVVGEEDASVLRADDNLRARVTRFVRSVRPEMTEEAVCTAIDRGGHAGGPRGRFWTLDPIDGTKGFLRREQYAIALALIQDGVVQLGILGCPAMEDGLLFAAIRGQGGFSAPISDLNQRTPLAVSPESDSKASRFCESVERSHSAHDATGKIAARLGITRAPFRIDSQCKYGAVSRGEAEIYLRLPTGDTYREKIWDHAAGALIVEEAGGRVTDMHGQALDFSQGRTLDNNRGIIATNRTLHEMVLEAVDISV